MRSKTFAESICFYFKDYFVRGKRLFSRKTALKNLYLLDYKIRLQNKNSTKLNTNNVNNIHIYPRIKF